eukprot:1561910-Amphidinium_carterae.1
MSALSESCVREQMPLFGSPRLVAQTSFCPAVRGLPGSASLRGATSPSFKPRVGDTPTEPCYPR